MNAFDKLKMMSDSKPKGKKSSAHEITDSSIQEMCDRLVVASKQAKNAEAELKLAHEEVLDYTKPLHSSALKDGDPIQTFKLNGSVMCIFTDRYSALKDEDIKEAGEILKKANVPFEKLFRQKVELKLKDVVKENVDKLEELMTKLGDLLPDYFEVSVQTLPVDDFDKALAREKVSGELSEIAGRARYKPTIRVC